MHLPSHNPIFILGNQKSGTTAIAQLLSHATEKSLTCDLKNTIRHQSLQLELQYQLLRFEEFLTLYANDFENEIIKEPFLSFYLSQILTNFPNSQIVFILRDPFQNIRSILNRLKIPGNLDSLELFEWPELNKTPVWKLSLQSTMLGFNSCNYIQAMAFRWNFLVNLFKKNTSRCTLVKYEDFNLDKEACIKSLSKELSLEYLKDISEIKDKQFQPKGNANVNLYDFFGAQNFNLIYEMCQENLEFFYPDLVRSPNFSAKTK
jgi:hypothetical protein